MARPKQFEIEEKLNLAADLFWRKGYANTSLSDLESHLGIGRKSIYDTFGDKHRLFLKVLDSYLQMPLPIVSVNAAWDEIEAMLRGGPPYDDHYKSCLFVNTIQEFGLGNNEEIQSRINRHIERLDMHFSKALGNAVARKQIIETDIPLMTKYLTATLISLSVMSKSGCSKRELNAIVDVALKNFKLHQE